MSITEKVAYIKGLMAALDYDENNKKDMVIKAIVDLLDDITYTVSDLEDCTAELAEQIDAVDEDLAAVEDFVYEDDCCDCDDDEEDEEIDGELYEVECPNCHDIICLDEDMLDEGSIDCPNCGTNLEFDFECDCCDGDCDCEE